MGRSNILKLKIMAKEREYICNTCGENWVSTTEKPETDCTECLSFNIREI